MFASFWLSFSKKLANVPLGKMLANVPPPNLGGLVGIVYVGVHLCLCVCLYAAVCLLVIVCFYFCGCLSVVYCVLRLSSLFVCGVISLGVYNVKF